MTFTTPAPSCALCVHAAPLPDDVPAPMRERGAIRCTYTLPFFAQQSFWGYNLVEPTDGEHCRAFEL